MWNLQMHRQQIPRADLWALSDLPRGVHRAQVSLDSSDALLMLRNQKTDEAWRQVFSLSQHYRCGFSYLSDSHINFVPTLAHFSASLELLTLLQQWLLNLIHYWEWLRPALHLHLLRDCVQCRAFQAGEKKDNCERECSYFKLVKVKERSKLPQPTDQSFPLTHCKERDANDCWFYFTYAVRNDTNEVFVLEDPGRVEQILFFVNPYLQKPTFIWGNWVGLVYYFQLRALHNHTYLMSVKCLRFEEEGSYSFTHFYKGRAFTPYW